MSHNCGSMAPQNGYLFWNTDNHQKTNIAKMWRSKLSQDAVFWQSNVPTLSGGHLKKCKKVHISKSKFSNFWKNTQVPLVALKMSAEFVHFYEGIALLHKPHPDPLYDTLNVACKGQKKRQTDSIYQPYFHSFLGGMQSPALKKMGFVSSHKNVQTPQTFWPRQA